MARSIAVDDMMHTPRRTSHTAIPTTQGAVHKPRSVSSCSSLPVINCEAGLAGVCSSTLQGNLKLQGFSGTSRVPPDINSLHLYRSASRSPAGFDLSTTNTQHGIAQLQKHNWQLTYKEQHS